jgi:WD40 repeat protein
MFRRAQVFDLTNGRFLYSPAQEPGREIEAVGLSPDGKTLAAKDDKFLYFWDAATGNELRRLNIDLSATAGGRSPTDWITFSPDGRQVAVSLTGSVVQLIDVATCQVTRTFARGAPVRTCAFSPDGKLLATGGYEQDNGVYYARILEVATGNEVRRLAIGHELNLPIGAIAFSHDGTMLAGAAWRDGRLRLFEVATGRALHVSPKIGEDIRGVAFAPDGKTVAAAGDKLYLYDTVTGKERLSVERRAQRLAFSQDGTVLTGAVSGAIYRWDAATGRQLTPATAQDSAIEQIIVSADGQRLFTTDQDGDLYVWDTAGDSPPRRIARGVERGVIASKDRRFLAWIVPAENGNSRMRLYDTAADRVIDRGLRSSEGFSVIAGTATVAAFLPDGKSLLTFHGGPPPTYRLWDVESGQERRSFAVVPSTSGVRPRGVPMAEDRGTPVRLWDVVTGQAGRELDEPTRGMDVPKEAGFGDVSFLGGPSLPSYTIRPEALSPDGTTLAVGPDWAGTFSKRRIKSMDGRAFSPDGRLVADWAENPLGPSRLDHVYIWHAATGRSVATLTAGPRNGASNAAFAPDGRTFATASADGVIRLWEVATWRVRAEFRGHRDRITAVAFGPDGRLFSGGLDSAVFGWDVRPLGAPPGTLANAWEALADPDAKAGYQAQGRFLAEAGPTVDWLATRVTPVVKPDPARVTALITDLDSPNFTARERATADLKEYGPLVADALRAVVAQSSLAEGRRRAADLLREIESGVIPAGELRALRAVEVLEWLATPTARERLAELSKGAKEARLTRAAAASYQRLERR